MKRRRAILIVPIALAAVLVGCGVSQPTPLQKVTTGASNRPGTAKPNNSLLENPHVSQLTFFTEMNMLNSTTGFISGYYNNKFSMWITSDGGLHWRLHEIPGVPTHNVRSGAPPIMYFQSKNIGWIAWITRDKKQNVLTVLRTINGGRQWTKHTQEAPTVANYIEQIDFSSHDDGWIRAFSGGAMNQGDTPSCVRAMAGSQYQGKYNQVLTYHTTDSGKTWNTGTPLPLGKQNSTVLLGLRHEYPSGTKLTVELYPMDENDQFGRERLGGVSAWTNWEGDTIHLVVYPANETIHFLKSTVVHEYNHHYRIATLNNGHADVPLLEKIIREGLAEHFVGDVLGANFHGPWVDALSEDAAKALWETLYSVHAADIGEQTDALVFGGQNTDVPLWAGYSVGYYLVKWYRQLHPVVSVIDLTTKQCKEFIPNFRDS